MHSRHAVITRLQLVKRVQVLVELVITIFFKDFDMSCQNVTGQVKVLCYFDTLFLTDSFNVTNKYIKI